MNYLMNEITKLVSKINQPKQQTECNYRDNYYGDQACKVKTI